MGEQSHREEMSAAIKAQRERQAVPRSIAQPDDEPQQAPQPVAEDEPGGRRRLLDRLRGK